MNTPFLDLCVKKKPLEILELFEKLNNKNRIEFIDSLQDDQIFSLLEKANFQKIRIIWLTISKFRQVKLVHRMPENLIIRLFFSLEKEQKKIMVSVIESKDETLLNDLLAHSIYLEKLKNTFTLQTSEKVSQVIKRMKYTNKSINKYLYCLDSENRLVGVLTLRMLFHTSKFAIVSHIMEKNPKFIVASAINKTILENAFNQFSIIPIVDKEYRFLGIIKNQPSKDNFDKNTDFMLFFIEFFYKKFFFILEETVSILFFIIKNLSIKKWK